MGITRLCDLLGISIPGLVWARVRHGWPGVAEYFARALTRLLGRLSPDDLRKSADTIVKITELVKTVVRDFVPDAYKEAGFRTADAIGRIAESVGDGEYTRDELCRDIECVDACVKAWGEVRAAVAVPAEKGTEGVE